MSNSADAVGRDVMRGVTYEEYGHPNDVLQVRADLPIPQFGKKDVLVEVHAAALNPVDFKILKGAFKIIAAFTQKRMGFDFAGRVVAIGSKCTRLAVGDMVHGMTSVQRTGTLAEFIAVGESQTSKIAEGMDVYQAAALPLATLTGNSIAKYLRPESRVLVLGGASATGSAALQVARVHQAGFVAATCSPRSEEYVKSLGADLTVNYREENVWEVMHARGLQFDVIFDAVDDVTPGDTYRGAVKGGVLANGGHLVTITGDKQGNFTLGEVMKRGWQITARNVECRVKHGGAGYHQYTQAGGEGLMLESLTAAGVRLKVDPHVFPLEESAQAMTHLMTNQAQGKVVVEVRPASEGSGTGAVAAPAE